MPSNTDYLSKLATYNAKNGIAATFSEMKKTARRMQKLDAERGEPIDINAYLLDYQDPTGEEATGNADAARNTAAASRRVKEKAASADTLAA